MAKVPQPPEVANERFDDWLFLFWKSVTNTVVGTSPTVGTTQVSGGGTGATSLTGYVVGNGTSPFTTVTQIPYSAISGTPIISNNQPPVTALNQNAGTGLYVLTSYGASTTVSITGTIFRLNVTNGNGVAGNPTIDIAPEYFSQQSNVLCFAAACG